MHFCFDLAEVLGVVDPRTIYTESDTELIALWQAHFSLKSTAYKAKPSNPDNDASHVERILMM